MYKRQQLQRDKGKEFLLLGKLAYNHSKEANMSNFTGNTEFFTHIEKIDSLSEKILEKEKEIETIKSETVSSEDNLSVTNSNEEESYKEESSQDVLDIEEIKLPGDDK